MASGDQAPKDKIDADFFYDEVELSKSLSKYEISKDSHAFYHCFGLDNSVRNNIHFIEKDTLLTSSGNIAFIVNINSWEKRYIFGKGDGGVGSIAVHPMKRLFAIAEKGINPNIYIYDYPSLKTYRILRGGTERAYSSVSFSHDGDKLASVGAAPDFSLTLWNWIEEKVILRCKAFGQEVFNVRFAPRNDGFLTTSGTGHIRFWKMASTFTGLKLQGSIGKFGKTELSDIEAFCVFPDGKVLSSTERGSLLLWDGNFIKCEILVSGRKLPHKGPVNVIQLDEDQNIVITGGADGLLLTWSIRDLEAMDAMEDDTVGILDPLSILTVGSDVHITGIAKGDGYYIVQDLRGSLFKILMPSKETTLLRSFHSGRINGLGTSPTQHFAATAGNDGKLCCWDYVGRRLLFVMNHEVAATSLCWAPVTLDELGRTVAVGFADGVLRVYVRGADQWIRTQALRPHSCEVNSIAYSPDGQLLASAGSDSTMFIFRLPGNCDILQQTEYLPLGFVNLPAPINHMSWRSDSERLLLALRNGEIVEICKNKISKDEESYELNVPLRVYNFTKLRRYSSADLRSLEEDKERLLEHLQNIEAGIQEPFFKNEIIDSISALTVSYSYDEEDTFFVTMGNEMSGMLYKCSFEQNLPVAQFLDSPSHTSRLVTSLSRKVIISGSKDGEVRIRSEKYPDAYLRYNLHDGSNRHACNVAVSYNDTFVLSAAEDGILLVSRINCDRIQDIAEIFNAVRAKKNADLSMRALAAETQYLQDQNNNSSNSKLCSKEIGNNQHLIILSKFIAAKTSAEFEESDYDGEILKDGVRIISVLDFNSSSEDFPKEDRSAIGAKNELDGIFEAPDICGNTVHSIQNAKLKLEEEMKNQSAELKKDATREVLRQLKEEFKALAHANGTRSVELQLNESFFDLDPEYSAFLRATGSSAREDVLKEMEHDREKSEYKVSKIQEKFLNSLSVELITISALKKKLKVQSFRCQSISKDLSDKLQQLHLKLDKSVIEINASNLESANEENLELESPSNLDDLGLNSQISGNAGQNIEVSGAHGFEVRKALRKGRKEQLEELISRKPGEDAEDPRDLEAISFAKCNIGDYQLKSSKCYVVPESQRVNIEKKTQQIILLEERIHEAKMQYNKKLLNLRALKCRLVDSISKSNSRLYIMMQKLSSTPNKSWTPEVDNMEWPENRMDEYLDYEINNAASESQQGLKSLKILGSQLKGGLGNYENEYLNDNESPGHLEKDIMVLEGVVEQNIEAFDQAIEKLRYEKIALDVFVKFLQMRLMELFQELRQLQNFEDGDYQLGRKLKKLTFERDDVIIESNECHISLESKRAELDGLREKSKMLLDEFENLINEANPLYPALLKCYKRKVKRSKTILKSTENDEFEEEEDDDDDLYDEDDEDDEDDEGEDICPPNCDQRLYERTLDLREKRLDHEENLSEASRVAEDVKKASDRLAQKQRQIEKELIQTESEIQNFQTEKQQRLNQIDVIMSLSLGQFVYADDIDRTDTHKSTLLPESLLNALVFEKNLIGRLQSRVGELHSENKELKQSFKNFHKEQSRLTKEKKAKEAKILQSEGRCEDLQLLKFGRLIDLEALDKAEVSKSVVELKKKVQIEENQNDREICRVKGLSQKLKLDLLRATEENTYLLEQIAHQSQRQIKLESELNCNRVTESIAVSDATSNDETKERGRLVQLVRLQSSEIEALKTEIDMLRHKSGHVYAKRNLPETRNENAI